MTNKPEAHTDLTSRSAGRHLITKMPVIHPGATIAEVEDLLLKKTRDLETINYIYVTDGGGKLVGVISVKEVFRLPKTAKIAEVMEKKLVTARPHTDQERLALLAIEHNLKEIPVVDAENRLMGVVPYDAILRVLREEHVEESLHKAGIKKFIEPGQTIINASVATLFKKRLPWLVIGLAGTTVAAAVIGYFRGALEHQLLLASFIPAVTYIADAVGTQSETLFIRTAALDRNFQFKKYFFKDIQVGLGLASSLAILMGMMSFLFWRTLGVSLVLSISFFLAILISMSVAILLPWVFSKFRIDPALIGGPLDTIISDIVSILIYFTVANIILGQML